MSENNNTFEYTYSPKDRAEIKKIREKYIPPAESEESALDRIRRLDKSVTVKGTVVALIFGIVGCLLLGCGMSMAMTAFGVFLGNYAMPVGISIGILGIVLLSLAYPLYQTITNRERKRIAPEILKLTDSLMK